MALTRRPLALTPLDPLLAPIATLVNSWSPVCKAAYEDNLGAISFLINADGHSEPVLISLTLRCTFPDLAGRGKSNLGLTILHLLSEIGSSNFVAFNLYDMPSMLTTTIPPHR